MEVNEHIFRNIVEASPYPIFLCTGEDMLVSVANAATLKAWGKDSNVIGKPFTEAIPELEGQPFIDLLRRVYHTGQSYYAKSDRADLFVDGRMQTFYFDFSYQAMRNAQNQIMGVLGLATDVTQLVSASQQLQSLNEKLADVNEEHAAVNEELVATNEELQFSQESLQHLNDELEERVADRTYELAESNEELAAINEELTTTNEELQQIQESLQHLNEKLEERVSSRTKDLSESEGRFRALIEYAPVAILVFRGEDMVFEMVNEAMLQVLDKKADIIGKPLLVGLPEIAGQPILNDLYNVYRTGNPFNNYAVPVVLNRNGRAENCYFNISYRPLYEDGQINGVIEAAVEVTDQINAQHQATQAEMLLRLAITAAKMGSWQIQPETGSLKYTEGIEGIFGYTGSSKMSYKEIFNQISENYREKISREIQQAIQVSGNYDVTYSQRRFDNDKLIWLRSIGKVITNHSSGYTTLSGMVMDVTEQVKAKQEIEYLNEELAASNEELIAANEELAAINEEMVVTNEEIIETNGELSKVQDNLTKLIVVLAESELRFRSLVEQAPLAIVLFKTHDLVIDIVNGRMLETWGKKPEIKGKTLAEAMPELETQPFIKILQDVITTGQPFYANESWAQITRNGVLVEGYFNYICQPIRDENGEINSVLQVVTDVTEQVKNRAERQKAEESMRMAVEAARLGSWYINPVNKALVYNPMLASLFGYEGEEDMTYDQAIGQVTEEYRPKIIAEIEKAIKDGGDYDFTYSQHRFNDDKIIWLRSIGKISVDENGEHTVFSGFVMDITEQIQDEQRKNDFIGIVSHELKTPLTTLSAYVQMLHGKAVKNEDVFTTNALDKVNKQVKKMTTMINGFLNVSRLESGKINIDKQRFDMAGLIKETEAETISTISSHRIVFEPVETTFVFADRDKIGQVISNYLSNAVKYSAAGSTINVACIIVGDTTQVSVRDEGIGISAQDIPQLFARYYRVEGKHTHTISGFGIGLYLCAEIINRHNGKIWVESKAGEGSAFYFSLPLG